jgi:hypothetical protein
MFTGYSALDTLLGCAHFTPAFQANWKDCPRRDGNHRTSRKSKAEKLKNVSGFGDTDQENIKISEQSRSRWSIGLAEDQVDLFFSRD